MSESSRTVLFVLFSVNCGGNVIATANEQTITSPGWPGNYTSSLHCLWVINPDSANLIRMQFTEFDLEPPSATGNSATCQDFVIVKEDYLETRICGDKDQDVFKINGNRTFYATSQLELSFFTDNNDFYKGFQAIVTLGE